AAGEELIVVTSRLGLKVDNIPIKNFRPIGEFELPEYELQRVSFPPIMQILQTSGIYHTDIPEYVRILTDDRFLESLAWSYMHWLYGQLDTVFVNSEQYRKCWVDRGFAPEKLKILPRGLDTDLFTPTRRDLKFWPGSGVNGKEVRLLYVGRISREKDLD